MSDAFVVVVNGELHHLDGDINMNQSRLQYFLDCKRKYWWTFEVGLVPDRPRWALEDGKAFHEGMAVLSGGHGVEAAVKIAKETLRASLPKQKLIYDQFELNDHVELVEKLIRAYDKEYEGKPTYQALGVETEGRVEVGEGSGVYLVFRTDKLVNWANRIWIMDHKTAAKLDMRDVQKYEMDLQFTAYVYGASKVLGQRVAGVIVDLITKAQTPKFHQEPYVRDDRELQEFKNEFVEMSREIAWRRMRVERGGEDPKTVWYKNTKECFRYGTCPYRDLCMQDTPVKRMLFMKRDKDYVDAAASAGEPNRGSGQLDQPPSVGDLHTDLPRTEHQHDGGSQVPAGPDGRGPEESAQ